MLINISLEVVLGIIFFTFNRKDIQFIEQKFIWKTYTATKALPITRTVEIIDKKKFAVATLNIDNETFVVHIVALAELTTMLIYLCYQAQVALLTSKKTGIPAKYSEFSDVFSSDSAAKLPEHTGINNYLINLLDDKQLPYGPIYSLGLVELKMLKTYIEANLASGFIRLSKSSTNTLILFVQKKNSSFRLCINYQGLNNLTIKNDYSLLFIDELLNCLDCAKHFT